MTKWNKYRNIKPAIKDIIKNKENSYDVIEKRRVKTYSERLFINIYRWKEDETSSEEKLSDYRVFSKEHSSLWIPVNQLNIRSPITSKKVDELKKVIKNKQIIWMYMATGNDFKESGEIGDKAKVLDIIFNDEEFETPDKTLTSPIDTYKKSKLWIKVDNIKRCLKITRNDI